MTTNPQHPLAERASWEELHRQISTLSSSDNVLRLNQAKDRAIAILNPQRQVVFLNQACVDCCQLANPDHAYGCRIGELFKCASASEGAGGCGTSEKCTECSLLNTRLTDQANLIDDHTYQMTTTEGQVITLSIKAVAMPIDDIRFTLVTLERVSHPSFS